MSKKIFRLLSFALFTLWISSCAKDSTNSVENFINDSLRSVNRSCMGGEAGCFELIFPVTVAFSDGTTATVNSFEEMKAAFKSWKESNPDSKSKPTLVFPIDVLNQDGEIVTLNSESELKELAKSCGGTFDGPGRPGHGGGRPGHGGHGTEPCFTINFPLTLAFPDATTLEVADKLALKQALKQWKMDNPTVTERPTLVFPITVTMADGTVVTVNSQEELMALKENCRG